MKPLNNPTDFSFSAGTGHQQESSNTNWSTGTALENQSPFCALLQGDFIPRINRLGERTFLSMDQTQFKKSQRIRHEGVY